MKNINNILLGIMTLFVFQACSEDKMDEINKNPDNPADVPAKQIITDVMTASAFTVTGSDYSFYAGIYSELNAGADNQMYNAQIRSGEPQLATTYNNIWNASYRQLRAAKIIIEKCSEGGNEAGNYQVLGIAQILYAYNLAILTDLFGDIPHSEALQPGVIFQPKLDKQEEIYEEVFQLLNEGMANLDKTSEYDDLGAQDLVYPTISSKVVRNERWKKVANGLLARYTMRLSYRKPDYAQVLTYVNTSFVNAQEEFKFVNAQVPNPFARFEANRQGIATSKSFYELMQANGSADIRTEAFFTKIGTPAKVVPLDNASVDPDQGRNIYSKSAIMSEANPIYLMSYHELLFLKAEAQSRLGLDAAAETSLKEAITAAYAKTDNKFADPIAAANTYIATIPSLTGNDLLKKIMVEKYISFYENEAIEVYNDIRRLKAMGNGNFISLMSPFTDKFPKRFGYGNSDVTTNRYVREAFGNGTYVYSEDVWWAGGTR